MLEIQRQNGSVQSEIGRFKVVLLGNMFVGKSSLVVQFAKGQFNPNQENTIGAAFLTQTINVDGATIKLDMWDTAGQERYHSIVRFFYRGAQAAIIVYDITDEETFEGAKEWVKELRKELGSDIPIVLAGNKLDLADMRMIEYEEAQVYADENQLIFIETSAKTTINVNEMFLVIAKKLYDKKGQSGSRSSKGIKLSGNNKAVAKSSKNCCR